MVTSSKTVILKMEAPCFILDIELDGDNVVHEVSIGVRQSALGGGKIKNLKDLLESTLIEINKIQDNEKSI